MGTLQEVFHAPASIESGNVGVVSLFFQDHTVSKIDGSVAKNGRFMAKTGRLPRPSHAGSLLWPNLNNIVEQDHRFMCAA